MILANARLLDGTGRPAAERAVVRIEGDRIVEVGAISGPAQIG
jgi:hypothetical protein